MKLGIFSISLSVEDLDTSLNFYEKLGFSVFAGEKDKNYLILKNESTIIGLFQGMFPGNIMTFNPGWDENAQKLDAFDDVRDIQKHLMANGIQVDNPIDESTSGKASIMVKDPDGNVILLDQHV